MSWEDGKCWKCLCGFQTHNEDVWVEHLKMHSDNTSLGLSGMMKNHRLIVEGKK